MLIYQLVFGVDSGQVQCTFHDDHKASAGIGPAGQYNCFACGAKAHDEIGFICKYFKVGPDRALRIKECLDKLQANSYIQNPVTDEQRNYLLGRGVSFSLINKYFFKSLTGKLMFHHIWNGITVGYTWFNSPTLSNYNATAEKYHYNINIVAGMVTPYDDAIKYNTLVICEGEMDMLTAKSKGVVNAVAKLGGAKSYVIGGRNFQDKQIVICYDCDVYGREGAEQDATSLTERFNCKVKVLDLGLNDKEDLTDYFVKYGKNLQDFYDLIKNTSVFVPVPKAPVDKFVSLLNTLTVEDLNKLELAIKIKKEIGETTNE